MNDSRQIRPLALCVFRREDGALLLAPGYDQVKDQRFYRPLGGGIEFGERAEDAARREIREELGADVDGLKLLGIFENLFVYRGAPGHELVWLYEARFVDASFYARDVIEADEGGAKFEARWVPVEDFLNGLAPLYPDGLLEVLTKADTKGRYDGRAMGLTHVNLEVANPANVNVWETARCLVDSGAVYSVIPATILERLGIQPITTQEFTLANGDVIVRRRGIAAYRYKDRVGGSDVVFGEEGDATLLGAFTLESLGYVLDPLRRELRDLPMLLMNETPS